MTAELTLEELEAVYERLKEAGYILDELPLIPDELEVSLLKKFREALKGPLDYLYDFSDLIWP